MRVPSRVDHRRFWRTEGPAGTSERRHGGEKTHTVYYYTGHGCVVFGLSLNSDPFLLQTKCFICGIGNDYFDTVPHGFETHTLQEHNLANYL